jgi:hypothetical protein
VFRPAGGLADSRIVVDPNVRAEAGLWPGQEGRRAAFRGVRTTGAVVAVIGEGRGFFL